MAAAGGTGVSVTRRSPKPQRQVRFLGPPLRPEAAAPSDRLRRVGIERNGVAKLPARADVELGEDLPEVPLDGAGTQEETSADLGIRMPVTREPRDLRLLRREIVHRLDRALSGALARGAQL